MSSIKDSPSQRAPAHAPAKTGPQARGASAPPESDERERDDEFSLWDGPTPMPGDIDSAEFEIWGSLEPPESLALHTDGARGGERSTPVDVVPYNPARFGDEVVAPEVSQAKTAPPPPISPAAADPFELEPEPRPLLAEAFERLAKGNFLSAMMLAEQALALDPDNTYARRCYDGCKAKLRQAYAARLGDPKRVPRVVMSLSALRDQSLDARAVFLLSRIDGMSSTEEILDMSGMPELEAMRYLCELLILEVIDF